VLDVRLSTRGDKLGVDAPAGALTLEVKGALAEHKPALLSKSGGRTNFSMPGWPLTPEEFVAINPEAAKAQRSLVECPKCGSTDLIVLPRYRKCGGCGHEWTPFDRLFPPREEPDREAVAARGDLLRAQGLALPLCWPQGLALPLCWLPEPQEKVTPAPSSATTDVTSVIERPQTQPAVNLIESIGRHRSGSGSKSTPKQLRPALKWPGGKSYLARRIIARLPDHRVYVEPFCGGMNVLLNKDPAQIEIAGDRHTGLMNVYMLLRDRPEELFAEIDALSYDLETFNWACEPAPSDDDLQRAVRFLVKHRFSRCGLGKDFAWSDRLRGGNPNDMNAWLTFKRDVFWRVAARLSNVKLRCQKAVEVIREFDGPDTLFYLDPPYPRETRTSHNLYQHEMSQADHVELIELIVRCRGKLVISSYANDLYDRALRDWDRLEIEMPNHAGQTEVKQRRVEIVWFNPSCQDGQNRQGCFGFAE
jgi:DNA adenine methylase